MISVAVISCKKNPDLPLPPASFFPCEESVFWRAVMMAESSGNPKAVYMESWGEESLGLFQLSVSDSTRYQDCPKTREELFDPVKNTRCKDSIASTLRSKYPTESWSKVLGRYWSVVRRAEYWGKDSPGYKNFVSYAKSYGCEIK